jgi:hypothetical protein
MTYRTTTPIIGKHHGDPEEIIDWATQNGSANIEDVEKYVNTVYTMAPLLGLNPDVVVAQSIHETTQDGIPWNSYWWKTRGNPAGIGITGDPKQNDQSATFPTGVESAVAQLAHLGLYAGLDVPESMRQLDPRWDAAIDAGYFGIANTISDLTNTWAIDDQYGEKLAQRLNEMVSAGLIIPEEEDMATKKLHVILVAGHNSVGDGGNPTERALTPNLAKAYFKAFSGAGISVEWINPSLTPGGLDGLASLTARKIRDADADLVVAFDLHFNGASSGVHVIPAHNRKAKGGMLSTAIVAGRVPEDVMENNTLDVTFSGALAKNIVAANPGMYLWGTTGIMPENQTGVGLQGYRLAMMAYSAPWRDKSIRITVEHGGTNDAQREDFYNRCANAALVTVKSVLGTRIDPAPQPEPEPEPEPPTGDPGSPPLVAFLFGSANGYAFDANGPVSKLWLERGDKTGQWPRLVDVREDNGEKWFVFGDGSVVSAVTGSAPEYVTSIA